MGKATKICKVCGKEYPYCSSNKFDMFRWQDVACCQEHGSEYFAAVLAARSGEKAAKQESTEEEPAKEEDIKESFYDDEDLDFEDDEEDEEADWDDEDDYE